LKSTIEAEEKKINGAKILQQLDLERDPELMALCVRAKFVPFMERWRVAYGLSSQNRTVAVSTVRSTSNSTILGRINQLTNEQKRAAQLAVLKYRKALGLELHLRRVDDVNDDVLLFALKVSRSLLQEMIHDKKSLAWIFARLVDQCGACTAPSICSYCSSIARDASKASIKRLAWLKKDSDNWDALVHLLASQATQMHGLTMVWNWHRYHHSSHIGRAKWNSLNIHKLQPIPENWKRPLIRLDPIT